MAKHKRKENIERDELKKLQTLVLDYQKALGKKRLEKNILIKIQSITISINDKKKFIQSYLSKHFAIRESCKIMHISPNTLYYKSVDWTSKDAPVLRMIQEFLKQYPEAGLPSVTNHLKESMVINKKRVSRIMEDNGLARRKNVGSGASY